MKERTRARGWVVQVLYAWEARGGGADKLVPLFQSIAEEREISSRNRFYADALIRILARRLDPIEETIRQHLDNWSIERLSVVDRNVLRLGVAEILYVDDVEPAVTVKEAAKLAARFGTEESPRFIQGVLEAVSEELETGGVAGEP